jgi:hypothetical protein
MGLPEAVLQRTGERERLGRGALSSCQVATMERQPPKQMERIGLPEAVL